MPFATACCGIELMATGASRHDIARFGAEVFRFSPRQCDLMIVAGRVVMKMMPVLQRIWQQMPEPKWCISMGACASTGGVFDTYCVVQGIDRFIPVDMYIPGCPPRPEQVIQSIVDLQEKIQREGTISGREFDAPSRQQPKPLAGRCRRGSSPGERTNPSSTHPCKPSAFGEFGLAVSEFRGQTRVVAPPNRSHDVLAPSTARGFDMLVDVTCVDYLRYREARDRFGLVYLLANTQTNERITVRTFVNNPEPTVPSVVDLWEGANWLEREVWDMFGIRFAGPSRPAADPAAGRVHGLSAAEGLSLARARREAQFPRAPPGRELTSATFGSMRPVGFRRIDCPLNSLKPCR